jgi:hypothetical protein
LGNEKCKHPLLTYATGRNHWLDGGLRADREYGVGFLHMVTVAQAVEKECLGCKSISAGLLFDIAWGILVWDGGGWGVWCSY